MFLAAALDAPAVEDQSPKAPLLLESVHEGGVLKTIFIAAFFAPLVFLPALLLASRQGDRRNQLRALLGATTVFYGLFILLWLPLLLAFVTYTALAWAGRFPTLETLRVIPIGVAVGLLGLSALFVFAGAGVLCDKKQGYLAAWISLFAYSLLIILYGCGVFGP